MYDVEMRFGWHRLHTSIMYLHICRCILRQSGRARTLIGQPVCARRQRRPHILILTLNSTGGLDIRKYITYRATYALGRGTLGHGRRPS